MRPSELRNMTIEELREKERELRKELFNLRFQKATGEIQNPMRIKAVRKDIARILTIITEKERQKAAEQQK
ncbi:MAG: 50S ribosomal protein L29 [Nitrospirae bacterium]|nr:50S ribosomal protein L29 [Nitrospirota bacterium]